MILGLTKLKIEVRIVCIPFKLLNLLLSGNNLLLRFNLSVSNAVNRDYPVLVHSKCLEKALPGHASVNPSLTHSANAASIDRGSILGKSCQEQLAYFQIDNLEGPMNEWKG